MSRTTPEGRVKAAIHDYLRRLVPQPYIYMPVPMGFGATTLDFLVCHQGRFFAIETKRPGLSKMTPAQALCATKIADACGCVILENDPELPNVKRFIF